MLLSRNQAHFTDHLCRAVVWANSRAGWGPGEEFYVKITEVGRHPCAQRIYVDLGVSKTMRSDHIPQLAGDLQVYRNGRPLYAAKWYRPIADYFIALDPEHNYWGWYEWDFDTPHLGRRRA